MPATDDAIRLSLTVQQVRRENKSSVCYKLVLTPVTSDVDVLTF